MTVYNNFLGDGHSAKGHWNDPPKATLKVKLQTKEDSSISIPLQNQTKGLTLNESFNKLLFLLETIIIPPNRLDLSRKITDTKSRIEQFGSLTEEEVGDSTLTKLSELIKAIELKQFDFALKVHTDLMVNNYGSNSKWLLGVKRLIELLK